MRNKVKGLRWSTSAFAMLLAGMVSTIVGAVMRMVNMPFSHSVMVLGTLLGIGALGIFTVLLLRKLD